MAKNKQKRKNSKVTTLLIAIFTFLTALISFISKVYDRKQFMVAVKENEEVKVLVKETKEI